MRYLIGFMFLLAGLAALPLSVSAQPAEEDSLSSWQVDEGASLEQPAPEKPALELKLDDAGVAVVPSPPRTTDGYTLEEMELRVKRANIGLGVSVGVVGAGLVLTTVGGLVSWANTPLGGETEAPAAWAAMVAGVTIMAIGLAGTVASVILLRRRTRERDWLRQAHYGTPRRVQWDLARSRLVF